MQRRLYEWAVSLDRQGLVRLGTYHAKSGDMITLLPRLCDDNAGLDPPARRIRDNSKPLSLRVCSLRSGL
jgi:hypothetical protein